MFFLETWVGVPLNIDFKIAFLMTYLQMHGIWSAVAVWNI